MKLGIAIVANENGEIIEERVVVITDGATTATKTDNHYDYYWTDERNQNYELENLGCL